MRGQETKNDDFPKSVSLTLNFSEWQHRIVGVVVKDEVVFLCGNWCDLMIGWIMDNRIAVLNAVRDQCPNVKRIKIYTDSHKL